MLVEAAAFWQVVLAIHILAVIVGFGVVFAYPLFVFAGGRLDPRGMAWFHRMQQLIGRRLINPALGLVLISGIYLASDLHQWKKFYVGWGIVAVIVIGGLEGAVMIPGEGKLAELAERDIAAAAAVAAGPGAGPVVWSPEYEARVKRIGAVGTLLSLLIVVTVYLMAVQA